MLCIAIGLLLVVSSSTGRIALIGQAGDKAMFLLGVSLITGEYVKQAIRHRQMIPFLVRSSRRLSPLDTK